MSAPAFPADIAPSATLGAGCTVDGGVRLGERVQLAAGVLVSGPAMLEEAVQVGAGARLIARLMQPSGEPQGAAPDTREGRPEDARLCVQRGAHIEAGALVMGAITIGAGALVRAGAVVTQSVPPHAVVEGAPARITGYVDAGQQQPSAVLQASSAFAAGQAVRALGVGQGAGAVQLHHMKRVQDMRGDLSVGEFAHDIPFEAQRYFLVYNVPSEHTRGAHAHKLCHQFLICVAGSCAVVVDDGHQRAEVLLDAPHLGLYMPPMIWGTQYKYSPGAVLLVYASHRYDPDDYIREYGKFTAQIQA